ncbi:MAG: adenylyl-sulfate kinase [Planctomycetota bacterium]|nr:MAG: adenylyl-sulfate kinase [Planctomycetota bacterium]
MTQAAGTAAAAAQAAPSAGGVYWITGLAGAGKTTLARLLVARLRAAARPVLLLDGDALRERVFPDAGFTREERLALALRYAAICELIAAQGFDVVCATISLFPEVWRRNRERLSSYREILLRAPPDVRAARKPRLNGPVVGTDIEVAEPPSPDCVLDNDGSRTPEQLVDELWRALARRGPPSPGTTASFRTKAETLAALEGRLDTARVLPQQCFEVRAWRANPAAVLDALCARGWLDAPLIVRSSARCEDGERASQAGRFPSIQGCRGEAAVRAAIDRIAAALPDAEGRDQIFVQPQLVGVRESGVVFTRDPASGGRYAIVCSDSTSGATDAITSGRAAERRTRFHHASAPAPRAPDLARVLALARELCERFGRDALDVEYAIGADGELYLLQVRPLRVEAAGGASDDDEARALARVHARVAELGALHPYQLGGAPILGAMPDWNPAEVLGARPRPLALSLYRELVTDGIWAYQRRNYGYRDLRSFPLLVSLAGLPYVDVRTSFHSFVPADLDDALGARLVDEYARRLLARPPDHDKVEFAIVYSCATLDLDARLAALAEQGFAADDRARIAQSLRALTNRITAGPRCLFRADLAKIAELERRQRAFAERAANLDPLARVYWLLEDCKRYGTLPFAGIARAAFIALQILDSLVATGLLERAEREQFLHSLHSVRAGLERDLAELPRAQFLRRHGHLRPGTYEITSPRYDEEPQRYFAAHAPHSAARGGARAPLELDAARRARIDRALAAAGLEHDASSLFAALRDAIEGRENAKHAFTRSLSDALAILAEHGRALGFTRDDLSYAEYDALRALHAGTDDARAVLARSIEAGRARHAITRRLTLPPLVTAPDDALSFELPNAEPNYVGRAGAEGPVVGVGARPEELRGAIVAIPSADPGHDWIFAHDIAAFVTLYGGYNSHMSIRALELGIPAVIGAGEVLYGRWSAAQRLRIDCANRRVEVLA